MTESTEKATFAGGCFWCMQPPYDNQEGVLSTAVGYIGGHVDNPTYDQVCSGTTGHTEAIEVLYDPALVTYEKLLEIFWKNIDPTMLNGQFADRGTQYRTGIFYHNEEQKQQAETSKTNLENSGKFNEPVMAEISPASTFYPAEDYHQAYYQKSSLHYERYKHGSGRASYLKETWGSE